MEPSIELCEVVRRFYRAVGQGDADTMRDLVSESNDVVLLGVEREEWFEGTEWHTRAALIADDVRGAVWQEQSLRAWTAQTMGWAVDRPVITSPDGRSTEFRLSAVFCLERAYWRIVHAHASIGLVRTREGDCGLRVRSRSPWSPPITPSGASRSSWASWTVRS